MFGYYADPEWANPSESFPRDFVLWYLASNEIYGGVVDNFRESVMTDTPLSVVFGAAQVGRALVSHLAAHDQDVRDESCRAIVPPGCRSASTHEWPT